VQYEPSMLDSKKWEHVVVVTHGLLDPKKIRITEHDGIEIGN
jgi:hypothetical protein